MKLRIYETENSEERHSWTFLRNETKNSDCLSQEHCVSEGSGVLTHEERQTGEVAAG